MERGKKHSINSTANLLLLGFKVKLSTSSQDEQGMGLVHGSSRHKWGKNNRTQSLKLEKTDTSISSDTNKIFYSGHKTWAPKGNHGMEHITSRA